MSKKKTTEQFIEEALKIHNNKYDYSLAKYDGAFSTVKIICPIHGVFEQMARTHLFGHCCYSCNIGVKSINEFIKKSKDIHNNKYDYSLVDLKKSYDKIKIICPIHGVFEQTPNSHLQGCGCPKCKEESLIRQSKKRTISFEVFEEMATKKFSGKYSYNKNVFIKMNIETTIICPIHGPFSISPSEHLRGRECPKCSSSSGENKIREILLEKEIVFEEQKKFCDCINKNRLRFDFYIPSLNLCIEYQGRQHYMPIEYFGGVKAFKEQKQRDDKKREYCKNNNILLKEISYEEDIAEQIKQLLKDYEKNDTSY